jgi:hypothetical protein
MAERHAEAICALPGAATEARLAGGFSNARRLRHAVGHLCEEVAGFWPRHSLKSDPDVGAVPPSNDSGAGQRCQKSGSRSDASPFFCSQCDPTTNLCCDT